MTHTELGEDDPRRQKLIRYLRRLVSGVEAGTITVDAYHIHFSRDLKDDPANPNAPQYYFNGHEIIQISLQREVKS